MRLQIASDLHHEFIAPGRPGSEPIALADGVDVLVLAGDIHSHANACNLYRDYPVPVVYVHGNHELYRSEFHSMVYQLRMNANDSSIRLLERDEIVIDGVRFIGTCLWTDYCLQRVWKQVAMSQAEMSVTDHRLIRYTAASAFSPRNAEAEHAKSRAWLDEKLRTSFNGPTVIVTHHAPHPESIPAEHKDDVLRASFASDLTPLVERADLWIHGHIHASSDYRVGRCRVICNPRGYPNRVSTRTGVTSTFENSAFDPAFVVDI